MVLRNEIRPQNHIQILGVLLHQTLSWEVRISVLVRRSGVIQISLYKIRRFLSPDILKILVVSHAFPHLKYCSLVWGAASKSRLKTGSKRLSISQPGSSRVYADLTTSPRSLCTRLARCW